ncbi:CrcB protein [Lentibacillus halodurans]|uniref:Fluoride-specific ion channel FluC n=1 Tax=Lentibacillus halodurans TaxID=237679 RepID=A0A1I0X2I6_9BACI|nr:fluoride efflux transporter CrcB [Lentibacillus halodurans]SFA94877.1 CrcB protein [Lentibacillus halodurans]
MRMLLVMAGGFCGAIARFTLGEWIYTNGFPLNTLLINLAGCLLLGWFLTFVSRRGDVRSEISLLIGTGFIGSFTTFSTFSMETIQLFQAGLLFYGIFYILASTIGGLLLVYTGYLLAVSPGKAGGPA